MMLRTICLPLVLAVCLLTSGIAYTAETVFFEPVRAPSKGPDNAPVTVIEIADFM